MLKPNGAFMLIDIFLEEDEDRDSFVNDVAVHVRNNWTKLKPEERENLVNHMFNFDFPAKVTMYERWAIQDSLYKSVQCLASVCFYKTIVLEV